MRYSMFFVAILATFFSFSMGMLAACGPAPESTPAGCIDNGDCEEGFACVQDSCSPVECLDSSQCGQGEYCGENYVCRVGCLEDADCLAGENCNIEARSCEEYGCRDTQLDCSYGEFCDEASGECYQDSAKNCEVCSLWDLNACGANGACFQFDALDLLNGYCLIECNAAEENPCPRGFDCYDPTGGNGQAYCSAWCPEIEGYL